MAVSTVFDVIHQLIDRAAVHDAKDAEQMHDAVQAHVEGKSLEDFQKAKAAAAAGPQSQADEDAILERAKQIQAQRDANAEQQAQIAARAQAQRPATPVAVGDTPSSPTAEPDASPTL